MDSLGFRYDGDGNRLARIVNGTLTTHTLDVGLRLPEVLMAHGGDGATRYLHLLSGVATDDGTGWSYGLSDHLGSERQRVDASGQVVNVNGYRPFGLPLAGDGGDPYGFTGEWWNAYMNRLYLRARWYAPEIGRFISLDTIVPEFSNPQDLNLYAYVLGNPINYTDPSGHRRINEIKALQLYIKGSLLKHRYDLIAMKKFYEFMRFATSLYEDNLEDTDQFMIDVTAVVMGVEHNGRWPPFTVKYLKGGYLSRFFLGEGAFDYEFYDPATRRCKEGFEGECDKGWKTEYKDDTGNQAFHFWFYVADAYFDGQITSFWGNNVHEFTELFITFTGGEAGNSKADWDLGLEGRGLGMQLRASVERLELIKDLFLRPVWCEYEKIQRALGEKTFVSEIPDWIESNLAEPGAIK